MKALETERLRIRPLQADDAPFLLELLNDPDFIQNIGDRNVRTEAEARSYIAAGPQASYERFGFGLWLVELRRTPPVAIGICGLLQREYLEHPDLGYALLPAHRGKGYALEAATAAMDYGRGVLGMRRILATATPGNAASIRLLEKLGFRVERLIAVPGHAEQAKLFFWTGDVEIAQAAPTTP